MLLYYALLSYWLLTIAIAVITHFIPLLAAASAYGKLSTLPRSTTPSTSHQSSSSPTSSFAVADLILSPRLYFSNGRCFTLYYSIATLFNALLLRSVCVWYSTAQFDWLLLAIINCNRWLVWQFTPSLAFSSLDRHWPPHIAPPANLLTLYAMYQTHFLRRLWECWRVHRFSASSRQHVLVLLFGVLFYTALILSPVIDQLKQADTGVTQAAGTDMATSAIAVIVFVSGSVWQHHCHCALAELRKPASSNSVASTYSIPRGSGFSYLLCPHYTAELLVYLSFVMLRSCLLQWLALVWTAVNLSITAHKTRHWYASKWPHADWTSKWNIVPFVM